MDAIPQLDRAADGTLSLPAGMEGVAYGEGRGEGEVTTSAHVAAIQPVVLTLTDLEVEAQLCFLGYQNLV